jgi:hypothetical protein
MMRFLSLAALASVVLGGIVSSEAVAQQIQPRPRIHGRTFKVKVDSSPQQAAVYWDAGDRTAPKDYGIAGYTPITLTVPKGSVRIIVELNGWKSQEQIVNVRKKQTVTFTLERAPQPARLDLQSAANGSAVGGDVLIDGAPRGTLPNTFELVAGHHQVEVRKNGFKPFSDWVDVVEGERRTREITLEAAAPPPGTLLVTSDVGGDVYLDGVRKDVAPAIIPGVPAGDHVIEVRKEGSPPWRQTVTVAAGSQTKVAANFGAMAAADASLRVISNEPDVTVFVDGEDKGRAPVTVAGMKPGQHIVEGRKTRFKNNEQNVQVVAGQNQIVQLRMEAAPPDRPHAGMKVQSTVPNAEVFVDGSSMGRAPVDRNDLDPGKHYVVVHKDGFTDFKREVVLLENQTINLVADLSATGSLRILSTPEGADVRIDGELIGKTPVVRDTVQAGDHVVEFRMPGYFDHKEQMKVDGGREKIFSIDLKQLPTGPTPEQVQKRKTGMSSFGAKALPVGGVTADFGSGFPYYFMARLTVGAWQQKPLALDVGVEFLTFFQIYDLDLHARLQFAEVGPLSLAARADLGGGTGVNGRDTYFYDIMGIASLAFNDIATVSGTLRVSGWSDKFCPSPTQRVNGVTADDFCSEPQFWTYDPTRDPSDQRIFDKDPNTNRFSGTRLYLGIGANAALDRMTSLFIQFEVIPFPDQLSPSPRMAFQDQYNSAMPKKDPFIYGQGGVSLKF